MVKRLWILVALLLVSISVFAFEFDAMQKQVKKISLKNGATVLVLENHDGAVVHCVTVANVGAANEPTGKYGMAHFLEHLAFKGSTTIGTKDYKQEKYWQDKADSVFHHIVDLKASSPADTTQLAILQKVLDKYVDKAQEYIVPNEFTEIYRRNGSDDLNAATAKDMTMYQISLPSNKLELWMNMEADRFANPVFREFYKERQVILEEKRMTFDNSPQAKFMAKIAETAFTKNPYRIPVIGYQEDIESVSPQDVESFFRSYYGAKNLVFAVYGDVKYSEVKKLAEKYLSKIPSGGEYQEVKFDEPAQTEERVVRVEDKTQPMLMVAYHCPAEGGQDDAAIDGLVYVLGQSQMSRLKKILVDEKKIAAAAFAFRGYPGRRYPNLLLVGMVPAPGHTLEECLAETDKIIADITSDGITETELQGFQREALKSKIGSLDRGLGVALGLAITETFQKDYRKMFDLEEINKVTKTDVQRVGRLLLAPTQRTVGYLTMEGGQK